MIEEQLRAINAGQIHNGMIVGPAFATVRDLVVQYGRAYTSKTNASASSRLGNFPFFLQRFRANRLASLSLMTSLFRYFIMVRPPRPR
jgi:hypothetical protein